MDLNLNRDRRYERVFADDPHAPQFVKRAIRLAGLYQHDDGDGGRVARLALAQSQGDYGAFVVYERLLSEWHERVMMKRVADDIASASDVTVVTADEGNPDSTNGSRRIPRAVLNRGLISGLATAAIIGSSVNFYKLHQLVGPYFVSISEETHCYIVGVICLGVIGILVGVYTSRRVALTHGLSDSQRRETSIFRASWFAGWISLIFVFVLEIILGMLY